MAVRVYLSRFAPLVYADHTIFTGIGYTDAHVSLNGLADHRDRALLVGAMIAGFGARAPPATDDPRSRRTPAAAAYILVVSLASWYVAGFIVQANDSSERRTSPTTSR